MRLWALLACILIVPSSGVGAAPSPPSFYVSISNSLRFFADAESQRQHLRDYCLYLRCGAGASLVSAKGSGQAPEGLCGDVIRAATDKNGGNACRADRYRNRQAKGERFWEPFLSRREMPTYRTIWSSENFEHIIDDRFAGKSRAVEFEIKGIKNATGCIVSLRHGEEVKWSETRKDCRERIERPLEISSTPYVVEAKLAPGSGLPDPKPYEFTVRHLFVMAFGDSIGAGEGLPDQLSWPDDRMPAQWLERRCHRSYFNYSLTGMSVAAEAERTMSIDYFNYACSGAVIRSPSNQSKLNRETIDGCANDEGDGGLLSSYAGFTCKRDLENLKSRYARNRVDGHVKKPWLPAQLDDAKATLAAIDRLNPGEYVRPDYAMISIGGNDVLFAKILTEALFKDECDASFLTYVGAWAGVTSVKDCFRTLGKKRVKELPSELAQMASKVQELRPRRVLLVGYLSPVYDEAGKACSDDRIDLLRRRIVAPDLLNKIGGKVTASEAEGAYRDVLQPLNTALSEFVDAQNKRNSEHATASDTIWTYVDPNSTYKSSIRGWCATPSWFTIAEESKIRQDDIGGTAHPNIFGQNALNYTVRCHMAQHKSLAPEKVCKSSTCTCVSAPKLGAPRQ